MSAGKITPEPPPAPGPAAAPAAAVTPWLRERPQHQVGQGAPAGAGAAG